jgi:alanyl-tRNA synthetase
LYYTDPYKTRFATRVIEELTWSGDAAVILDKTAFYPASGGQPADTGTLGTATVLDVIERESDGDIIHVLSDPVHVAEVTGEVFWPRRFDHMQQHTGQHILSAAFEKTLDAATVGFHMGAESTTIDVDVPDLDMDRVLPIETLVNHVVWDDRTVGIRLVDGRALEEAFPESPPDLEGPIRLVEIAGAHGAPDSPYDLNPCGGTHVGRTGEVGLIKITGLEHRGRETRVEFVCGGRALRDYEAKRRITSDLVSLLTVGASELVEAVERIQEEAKALRHSERDLRQRLLDMESAQLVQAAHPRGPYRIVGQVWAQRSPQELQILARKLAEHGDVIALLFSVSDRVHFCFARGETAGVDVNVLVQKACAQLNGKGGGRPQVAQGSAPRADVDQVMHVLRDLEAAVSEDTVERVTHDGESG